MKSIRKIAGKVTALAVALFTTISLLNPHTLKAWDSQDGYVNTYDSEEMEDGGGGSGGCENPVCFNPPTKLIIVLDTGMSSTGSRTNSGGGSVSITLPKTGTASGNGSSSGTTSGSQRALERYVYICSKGGGCKKDCTSVDGNGNLTYYTCSLNIGKLIP